MRRQPRIAIIGAGVGGIGLGAKLRRVGFDNFVILESESRPGGTWYRNSYPGLEIDTESATYDYSFFTQNWKRAYATGEEIREYLQTVFDRAGLAAHTRFGTRVESIRWDDDRLAYELTTADGATEWFDLVASATGFLSDPRRPDWAVNSAFQGTIRHTIEIDPSFDFTGRTVAVIGTGSTATQLVPAIADATEHVYVFQREPGWILPKAQRIFDETELKRYSSPIRRKLRRYRYLFRRELRLWEKAPAVPGSRLNRLATEAALRRIAEVFAERPDLAELVTPTYPFGGKRTIQNSDFYPSLLKPTVTLVPKPAVRLTADAIVDADGFERKVDTVILATGFHGSQFQSTLNVKGRGGLDLREEWAEGAYAFLGLMVPRFPNFFMIYGPNTNGGQALFNMERQAEYIIAAARRWARRGPMAIEPKHALTTRYNDWLQESMKDRSYFLTNNYFTVESASGRKVVTNWPGTIWQYWFLLRSLRRFGWTERTSPSSSRSAVRLESADRT